MGDNAVLWMPVSTWLRMACAEYRELGKGESEVAFVRCCCLASSEGAVVYEPQCDGEGNLGV